MISYKRTRTLKFVEFAILIKKMVYTLWLVNGLQPERVKVTNNNNRSHRSANKEKCGEMYVLYVERWYNGIIIL